MARKVAGIKQNKEAGTWYISTRRRIDDNHYIKIYQGGYLTQADAKDDFDRVVSEKLEEKGFRKNKQVLLKDVIEEYMENYASKNKKTTVQGAMKKVDLYFNRYFKKDITIDEAFQINNLEKWRKSVLESDSKSQYKNRILGLMERLITRSIHRGLIEAKDFVGYQLVLEHTRDSGQVEIKDEEYWTKEQFNQFIQTFDDESIYYVFFTLMFYTGLRIGEEVGLKWKDLLPTKELNVYEQIPNMLDENGKWFFQSPKSKLGYRRILLPNFVYDMLIKFKQYTCQGEESLIFYGARPLARTTLARALKSHIKMAGLSSDFHMHSFRHSHASMLINKCVENGKAPDILLIAKRLGHSPEETLRTYAHLFASHQDEVVELL